MSEYKAYKCKIKLMSSLASPLEADIIWGCMLWAVKYLYGKNQVEEIIYNSKNNPIFLVSDGFPSESLPVPMVSLSSEKLIDIIKSSQEKRLQNSISRLLNDITNRTLMPGQTVKNILKEPDILLDIIKKSIKCDICPLLLIPLKKLKKIKSPVDIKKIISNICNPEKCFYFTGDFYKDCRNVISTSVKEGLSPSLRHKGDKGEEWDIYILSLWGREKLMEILTYLGDNGYGKDISRGKGAFSIEYLNELQKDERIDYYTGQENGFMTISSSYMPLSGEIEHIEDARYKLLIKIGKLGGHLAGVKNFYKYPVVMCRAGSIFPAIPGEKKIWGQLAKKVHPDMEDIVQYGFAFPLWGNLFSKSRFDYK